MRRFEFLLTLPLISLALTGCEVGGVDSSGPDPSGQPDAGVVERDCRVPENHGALGALGGEASSDPQDVAGQIYRVNADIDAVSPKDVLSIQLWDARGAFDGAVAPGAYSLTGADTNFSTCGACVTIVADIVPMVGPTELYIAQSGTLTIDSVTPTLSGSLSDVVMQEFDLNTGAPIASGCETTIESATFAAAVQ